MSVFRFLEGSTAITRGQADPIELRVGAEYKLTKALKLTGSITRGLTDGAADWGVSAGLALPFGAICPAQRLRRGRRGDQAIAHVMSSRAGPAPRQSP